MPRSWLLYKGSAMQRLRQRRGARGLAVSPPPRVTQIPSIKEREAAVVLRLDPAGITLPDGRVAFKDRTLELRENEHLCIIGKNGSGKQLFWKALSGIRRIKTSPDEDLAEDEVSGTAGNESQEDARPRLSFMSFAMHREFLLAHGRRVVADVLGGSKDPLARQLIVQLGLYPVWYKHVHHLSTGEIRKVLLAYVLSKSPEVLVLDKPYDGLDKPSRQNLKALLSQLCQGFPRLLVDLGLSRRIHRTELLLITHRHEDIPEEVVRVVGVKDLEIELEGRLTELKDTVRESMCHSSKPQLGARVPKLFRPQVTRADVRRQQKEDDMVVIKLANVGLRKGDYVILQDVNWTVRRGEAWILKGLNGAGKTSILRLIVDAFQSRTRGRDSVNSTHEGELSVNVPHMGVVSTDMHLRLAAEWPTLPTEKVMVSNLPGFRQDQSISGRLREQVDEWASTLQIRELQQKPFGELSQGQQKLVIIARALLGAPSLLMMDEACQGLDSDNRALVLSLLDNIVRAAGSWCTLLYVSHHDDELVPSCTHVLDVVKGRLAFQGTRGEYP